MSSDEYQSQSAHNLTSRSSSQFRFNHSALLGSLLLLLVLIGSFLWREIQLSTAQQLVDDCVQNNNCSRLIEALETLVKGKKNLRSLNLSSANLSPGNLSQADLYRTNLSYADLENANLSQASLYRTNLSHTNLKSSNLERANLKSALLINTQHLTPTQIKSACNWEKAFYQGRFDAEYSEWIIDKQANQQFIQQLQQDKDSEPKTPVDCSEWRQWSQDR